MSDKNTQQKSHLVITALGADRPGLVTELSHAIYDSDCDIVDSRMIVLGGEFALLVQASGNWDKIARLESALPGLEQKLGLTLICKHTSTRTAGPDAMPYMIDVISLDHPGIVYQIASFLSKRGINIEEMATNTYAAAHTGTPMFSVHLELWIPADTSISEFRDSFMDLCDEMNLDAVIEPVKN